MQSDREISAEMNKCVACGQDIFGGTMHLCPMAGLIPAAIDFKKEPPQITAEELIEICTCPGYYTCSEDFLIGNIQGDMTFKELADAINTLLHSNVKRINKYV